MSADSPEIQLIKKLRHCCDLLMEKKYENGEPLVEFGGFACNMAGEIDDFLERKEDTLCKTCGSYTGISQCCSNCGRFNLVKRSQQKCPNCDGTGVEPEMGQPYPIGNCSTCEGTGEIPS